LEINYRSSPVILGLANRIFRDKPAAYRKVLRCPSPAPRDGHPPVVRKGFAEQTELFEWLAQRAIELSRRTATATGEMAALFRLNDSRLCAQEHLARHDWAGGAPVQCLTIHASKGLEFPVVFLCDLEEGVLPHYRVAKGRRSWWHEALLPWRVETPPGCDIAEETRLFYVGVTRARRHLHLLSVSSRRFGTITRRVRPSRFLRYA
jgi:superfamily I DNA/RNA helicase